MTLLVNPAVPDRLTRAAETCPEDASCSDHRRGVHNWHRNFEPGVEEQSRRK
jgi:hypothetical protein